jgi:CheY-like chemotaxis protein
MTNNIKSQQEKEKDHSIVQMSAQFVHDISTPLAIIQILAKTLETYLPGILLAHQQLKDQGADTIDIPSDQRELLESSAVKIKSLTQQVNQAAKDYWKKIDQQFESHDASEIEPTPRSINTISLEQPLNILVAEDDTIHQKIAYRNLSGRHKIDIANNGREAVEYCQKKVYDLILMDLQMPILDGQKAVIEIMQLKNPAPIIIGLTNKPLGHEKKQMLQQGFNGFIEKPLNMDELALLVKELNLPHD